MLNGTYKPGILNRHALKSLDVRVDIPKVTLGVGEAESWSPYDIRMYRYQPNAPTVVLPNPLLIPIEETGSNFSGNPVFEDDFPNHFYLGNPL